MLQELMRNKTGITKETAGKIIKVLPKGVNTRTLLKTASMMAAGAGFGEAIRVGMDGMKDDEVKSALQQAQYLENGVLDEDYATWPL